ncbi:hypothetical protein P3T76_014407 [Phytophthora citrophthora]|uniref:Uncharacterized protein n=1 Tax=Phytophthora citrophthora TaxID=4793 RepID=A0AAD9LCD5_9STRA|nr:hypothetical protein P3T76_014407 [Phytophthora citrophthora]
MPTMDECGYHCESMSSSFRPAESWKTLRLEKACNRTSLLRDESLAVNGVRRDVDAGHASQGLDEEDRHANDVEVQGIHEVKRSWNNCDSVEQLAHGSAGRWSSDGRAKRTAATAGRRLSLPNLPSGAQATNNFDGRSASETLDGD